VTRRSASTTPCAWCRRSIAIAVVDHRAPLELLDDEREPGVSKLADVLGSPLPDEDGVEVFHTEDGRYVMIHKDCLFQLAATVINNAPQVLEKLRPKTT